MCRPIPTIEIKFSQVIPTIRLLNFTYIARCNSVSNLPRHLKILLIKYFCTLNEYINYRSNLLLAWQVWLPIWPCLCYVLWSLFYSSTLLCRNWRCVVYCCCLRHQFPLYSWMQAIKLHQRIFQTSWLWRIHWLLWPPVVRPVVLICYYDATEIFQQVPTLQFYT